MQHTYMGSVIYLNSKKNLAEIPPQNHEIPNLWKGGGAFQFLKFWQKVWVSVADSKQSIFLKFVFKYIAVFKKYIFYFQFALV